MMNVVAVLDLINTSLDGISLHDRYNIEYNFVWPATHFYNHCLLTS